MYAWGYYCGAYLKTHKSENDETDYNGGFIISVLLFVIIGTMNLGVGASHYQSTVEAKVAGKIAFDTIDQKPLVDPNKPGKKVERD